jgi:hypothetical protein
MKIFKHFSQYILMMLVVAIISSCKKNNAVDTKDVDFSVSSNGYFVTYTNATTDAKSYKWDFGDGTTSTDVSPSHTYKTKGKFVVTLYATLNNGNLIQGSTIINVSKTSPIKLDDNTLADWDTITNTVVLAGPKAGVFQKAKFDYDSQNIYIYMEFKGSVAAGNIFDFYMDTDANATTGLLTGTIPGGGYDYLLEGPLLLNGLDQFLHTGAQTAFSFSQQAIPEYFKLGKVVEANGIVKFEMALVRSKIGGLTGKALNFGIIISDSGYNPLGSVPDPSVKAITLDISQ